jgi:hypothetical protein
MVSRWLASSHVPLVTAGSWLLAADDKEQPLLMRLKPAERASVLMALLGLVLVGLVLMTVTWLAGRYVRRLAKKPPATTSPLPRDWYRKRLDEDANHSEDEREETP